MAMTLAQLRTSTRSKADETDSGFIGNPVLDGFINQGARFVYNQLLIRKPDEFFTEGTSGNSGKFNTVAGTASYSWPTTAKRIVRVEMRPSTSANDDDYLKVSRLNIGNDRGDFYWPQREGYMPGMGYYHAARKVYFKPVPQQVVTVRLWFIPKMTALSADADVLSFDDDYHELVAEIAALQCLGKSGEGIFAERMKMYEMEFLGMDTSAAPVDQQPEQMVITDDPEYSINGGGF